tara:strand:- start:686 stop:1267 length:582 start_codon:yes stop_codon:yes gene_type:complete
MGFDITGLNPKNKKYKSPSNDLYEKDQDRFFKELEKYQSQKGTYFRNNVWWWRPLAHYVLEHTKVIDKDQKECWSYNDHCIIQEEEATQIAKQLRHLIKKGHTKRFEAEWEARRKTLEIHNDKVEKELDKHVKDVQRRMNDSNLAPKDFPKKDLDKWEKIYRKRNSDASYPFSIQNVEEFAEFCEYSGGFSIG